ncbi:MAG: hypothetical protein FJ254_07800 [Phycisphaerae bacterium]|nr:hypothetical protein [Phycisphaerae bacterium]
MKDAVIRLGSIGIAVVLAVVAGLACASLATDARGVVPVIPQASVSMSGWVAVAALWLVAWFVALGVGKAVNTAVGLFAAGCVLGVYAMRSGAVLDAAFDAASPTSIAIVSVVYALLAGVLSWSTFVFAGPLPDMPADPEELPEHGYGAFRPQQLVAALASIAAVVVVVFVARTDSKGQAIGAMTLGAMLAAMIARSIRSRTQPVVVFAAPALTVGLAQFVFSLSSGAGFDDEIVRGTVAPVLRLMPIDLAAGSLCGVALGYGMTKSGGSEEPTEE